MAPMTSKRRLIGAQEPQEDPGPVVTTHHLDQDTAVETLDQAGAQGAQRDQRTPGDPAAEIPGAQGDPEVNPAREDHHHPGEDHPQSRRKDPGSRNLD